jgi:hypothetical protein
VRDFISRYGSYNKVGFLRRDMYNMCSKEKRKLIENGDATTTLSIMLIRTEGH